MPFRPSQKRQVSRYDDKFFNVSNNASKRVPTAEELATLCSRPAPNFSLPHLLHSREHPWVEESDRSGSSSILRYLKLSSANAEIRLLTLLKEENPNGKCGPICCTLDQRVSLFDPPDFVALSYVWGNDEDARVIWVDGCKFKATSNLYHALKVLRMKGISKIWIDAICINQQDNEEKSQQIQRMRLIYSQAKQVVAWLGPESRNSNLAMYLLGLLSQSPSDRIFETDWQIALKERSINAPPGRFAEAWEAFDDLFAREYWKRVWIIQEIAASNDVLVCCGSRSISWTDLESAFWGKAEFKDVFFKSTPVDLTKHPRKTEELFDFWAWKRFIASAEPQPLIKALIDSRRSRATNPRDHVYALLGISSDASNLVPIPNYRLSVEQIYTDLATSMILAAGNLNIICLRGKSEERNWTLPSWIPDWSALADIDRPFLFQSCIKNTRVVKDDYVALFGKIDDSYRVQIQDGILCASGRIFGTVDGLSTGISDDFTPIGEICQPSLEATGYSGGQGHAAALHDVLKMLLEIPSNDKASDRTDLVHYLLRPKGIEIMETHGHERLANWLRFNLGFKICGVRLNTWFSKFCGEHWMWKKRLTHHYEDKATFTSKMDTYMMEIETVLRGGMRLMTTSMGLLGMAHPQARPGDLICLLDGMGSPVLLRECDEGELSEAAREKSAHIEEQCKMARYAKGMQIQTRICRDYKVVGEAFVRVEGMLKNVREAPCPFGTFLIH